MSELHLRLSAFAGQDTIDFRKIEDLDYLRLISPLVKDAAEQIADQMWAGLRPDFIRAIRQRIEGERE